MAVWLGCDGDHQEGLVCASPLPSYAEAFSLSGHPAVCIVRTEPWAPVRMVTLTIHCLQDKLGIL